MIAANTDDQGQGEVRAHVPLVNMFDYADKVRSLSQGRAASTLEPFEYRPAPDEVLHRLLHPEEYFLAVQRLIRLSQRPVHKSGIRGAPRLSRRIGARAI